jgi:protein tyrosine phosphatase (PTP) superfamily phosphohydrolase (DUF442 family)
MLWVLFAAVVLLILGVGRWIGLWGGNVRAVSPGKVYRSAQLWPDHLRQVIREHGIKTVLNLQGKDHGDLAQTETALCREAGAEYRHAQLSAVRLPGPRELQRVVDALDQAQYPILIHCRAGADRSGLVSALYLALKEGVSPDEAHRRELTWTKGHFGFQSAAMDRFFDLYRETSGGQDLRTWIAQTYPGVYFRETGRSPNPRRKAPQATPASAGSR